MKQNSTPRIINLFMLTIAGIVNAFGITLLMTPVKLYDSGISGTSTLFEQITPSYLSLSLFLLILNIPLYLIGLKKTRKLIYLLCHIYRLYLLFVCMAYNRCFSNWCKYCFTFSRYWLITLCTIWWHDCIGSGLAIRFGGAMDGIEVRAVIFSKRIGITVGTFVMIYNVILYIFCKIVLNSWVLPLYSVVAYSAALKTIDFDWSS